MPDSTLATPPDATGGGNQDPTEGQTDPASSVPEGTLLLTARAADMIASSAIVNLASCGKQLGLLYAPGARHSRECSEKIRTILSTAAAYMSILGQLGFIDQEHAVRLIETAWRNATTEAHTSLGLHS